MDTLAQCAGSRLTLSDREKLTVTGVTEVLRYQEDLVLLDTQLGRLTVEGQQLRLRHLTPESGQAVIEGTVTALIYEEPKAAGSFWGRFFR